MRNTFWIFLFFTFATKSADAQDLNDYRYVQVPEQYEFQKEANKYQLNELTAFLFEREGFEVFYEEEIPEDINICDVLKTNVKEDSGLFTTRFVISLENCKGEKVFTTKEGESREKDYKTAKHLALRDAFSSIEEIGYSYSGIERKEVEEALKEDENVVNIEEPAGEKLVAENALPETAVPSERVVDSLFLNGGVSYSLEKTDAGFSLFREDEEKAFATLLKSGGGSNYIFTSEAYKGSAYFDPEGNLVVEFVDDRTGQLVSVRYLVQD